MASALIKAAVAGQDLPGLVETYCVALLDAGLPLARAAVGTLLVHPQLDATLVVWQRGRDVRIDDSPRPVVRGSERWRQSPFYELLVRREHMLRCRLGQGERADAWPMIADLVAEGATDYVALRTPLAEAVALGGAGDLYSSWATERPGGFDEGDLRLLLEHELLAAVVFANALKTATARTLLATYLDADAAARVLRGAIERGHAETIDTVIWYSDLEHFTRLSDRLPRQELLDLLNAYAEAQVDAVEAEGGQILKFMGDGILATFHGPETADACAAALRAWTTARRSTDALSERRRAQNMAETRPYLALHAGEVLYGNIGGKTRLDFTVLGPAVNEAVRIAALCRSLDQQVVVSEAFFRAGGAARKVLVGLGRYALRGVTRPQTLYALDPGGAPV